MKSRQEQIQAAIDLSNIKETDIVSDLQAKCAYDLYNGLHRKPNFRKATDIVKPINNNTIQTLSPELFKKPERIKFLTTWILKILPFIDLLSNVGKLPLSRDNDFEEFICDTFANYLDNVNEIYNNIPNEYNLLHRVDMHNLSHICEGIKQSVRKYLEGYPSKAFDRLYKTIDKHISPNHYLDHIMTIKDSRMNRLYKMRIGTNHTYTEVEMFHIPFELRGLASTNRYSIPGLPCVYLGSSPLTCWEELNKPDLNTVQTSLFITRNISYLDFSTPPSAIIENLEFMHQRKGTLDREMTAIYKELISYIVVWPLLAACSIMVKNITHTFKPEYIIPQLLLQWVRLSKFDGICYFSTKVSNYTMNSAALYRNFAFPVQDQKKSGYCSTLRNKFTITDAIPWQLFQLYKNTQHAPRNEEAVHAELEFVTGIKLPYYATDFSRLESLLINKLNN